MSQPTRVKFQRLSVIPTRTTNVQFVQSVAMATPKMSDISSRTTEPSFIQPSDCVALGGCEPVDMKEHAIDNLTVVRAIEEMWESRFAFLVPLLFLRQAQKMRREYMKRRKVELSVSQSKESHVAPFWTPFWHYYRDIARTHLSQTEEPDSTQPIIESLSYYKSPTIRKIYARADANSAENSLHDQTKESNLNRRVQDQQKISISTTKSLSSTFYSIQKSEYGITGLRDFWSMTQPSIELLHLLMVNDHACYCLYYAQVVQASLVSWCGMTIGTVPALLSASLVEAIQRTGNSRKKLFKTAFSAPSNWECNAEEDKEQEKCGKDESHSDNDSQKVVSTGHAETKEASNFEQKKDQTPWFDVELASLAGLAGDGMTFKPSALKKNSLLRFIPINLHMQLLRVFWTAHPQNSGPAFFESTDATAATEYKFNTDELEEKSSMSKPESYDNRVQTCSTIYDTVTFGATAAHCLGFENGGSRFLAAQLGERLKQLKAARESVEWREDSEIASRKRLKISQTLSDLDLRLHVGFSQILACVVTCFASKWELGLMSAELVKQIHQIGFLFQLESLLSTQGSEEAMICEQ